MALSLYRAKLLNAVLYFTKHTRHLNETKLLKLLYYLDFTHFSQTGFPSIGLTYYTYKRGPVPVRFWKEIKEGFTPTDFENKFEIVVKRDEARPSEKELQFIAHSDPDLSVFTPRELGILKALANKYKFTRATEMSEETHLPNQPWDTTMKTRGRGAVIDYLLCLDAESRAGWEKSKSNLIEFYAAVKNFHLTATKPAEH